MWALVLRILALHPAECKRNPESWLWGHVRMQFVTDCTSLRRCRPSARPNTQSIRVRGKVQFPVPSHVVCEDLPRLVLNSISIQCQVLVLCQYTRKQVYRRESGRQLEGSEVHLQRAQAAWYPLPPLQPSSPKLLRPLQSPQMHSWPLYSRSIRKRHCERGWLL